jgi:type IV secretion system protein VirB5
VFGLIAMAQRSQFIPYIVEVDKLGQVAAIQSASAIDETNLPNVIKAMLASFIARARMVTPDQMLQAKAVREVYAHLISSDPATGKMNDWFNGTKDSTPFAKSEKILVNAEITAILPQSAETWQIDWTENTVTRKGEPVSSVTMRALVTVYLVPPTRATTEAEIQKNPIGLYVKDFNWSKVGL